jgi:hypothetical protein
MKKPIKKVISGLLCATIACGTAIGVIASANSGKEGTGKYVPIFRMAVASDIHLKGTSGYEATSYRQFLQAMNAYADADETYKGLDAVVVTGDLMHVSTYEAMNAVKTITEENLRTDTAFLTMLGNHDHYYYGSGSTDRTYETAMAEKLGVESWKLTADGTTSWYQTQIDERLDKHIIVNGIHLISLSTPDENGNYTAEQLQWLDEEIAKAATDDPTKPIFTFQHHHVQNTVFSTTESPNTTNAKAYFRYAANSAGLNEVYSKYPQVINLSGHTHTVSNNPRAIHQRDFTSIAVGAFQDIGMQSDDKYLNDYGSVANFSTSYYPVTSGGNFGSTSTDTSSKDYADLCRIIEVDANGLVRVFTYDKQKKSLVHTPATTDGDSIMEWFIQIGETAEETKSNFLYTDDRVSKAAAPTWAEGTSISVLDGYTTDTTVALSFAQANDDECLYGYQIVLDDGVNAPITKVYLDYFFLYGYDYDMESGTYAAEKPYIKGLTANTTYSVTVTPINIWGKAGTPLTGSVTTAESTAE